MVLELNNEKSLTYKEDLIKYANKHRLPDDITIEKNMNNILAVIDEHIKKAIINHDISVDFEVMQLLDEAQVTVESDDIKLIGRILRDYIINHLLKYDEEDFYDFSYYEDDDKIALFWRSIHQNRTGNSLSDLLGF